jgi:hypothetical protein
LVEASNFEFAAKHVGMNKTTQVSPEYPKPQLKRVSRMLRSIQPWLQGQRARVATFAEIEKWTGVPENTVRGWFAGHGNPAAEFLISLLERIPPDVQKGILDEFCRVYPTLQHPRLSSDRTVLSRLTTLLSQPRGFTYIQGGSDEARTFLITALGHSFLALTQPPRRALGVDVHAFDWFVPVPGVGYLENLLQPDELRRAVQSAWPQLRNGDSPLVIINGLWSAIPEFQDKIRALVDRCHVLVADERKFEASEQSGHLSVRTTLITVGSVLPPSKSISLEIQAR